MVVFVRLVSYFEYLSELGVVFRAGDRMMELFGNDVEVTISWLKLPMWFSWYKNSVNVIWAPYLLKSSRSYTRERYMPHLLLFSKDEKPEIQKIYIYGFGNAHSNGQSWDYMTSKLIIPILLLCPGRSRQGGKMVIRWTSCKYSSTSFNIDSLSVICHLVRCRRS